MQSAVARSVVRWLEEAVGQYQLYRAVLARQQPDRRLFLAVTDDVYAGILTEEIGQIALTDLGVRVLVFDPARREVIRWTS